MEEENSRKQSALAEGFRDVWDRIIYPELKQIVLGPKKAVKDFIKGAVNHNQTTFSSGLFDIIYFLLVISLVVFGLAVHYSASYESLKQVICAVGGIIIMIVVSRFRVSFFKNISTFLMAFASIFLFLVFTRTDYNGTHRWFFFFQPSEVAKITFILFLAYLMDKYQDKRNKVSTFYAFLAIVAFYGVLILAESHLSGCILFLCIGYAMMWFAGMNKKQFAIITVLVIAGALLVVWKPTAFSFVLHDYQINRIVIWKKILFNGDLTYNEKINSARQVLQSLYGIGSGGLFGVGFGNSGQKISNLQEKSNDFIFAVVGEELGFIGSMAMLFVYGFLVAAGFRIALRSKSYYGTLVALGISVQMALQVLINVAVATSLLPNTGISLPFFSDGGSSMLVTLVSMGIMLAISNDDGRAEKKNVKQ